MSRFQTILAGAAFLIAAAGPALAGTISVNFEGPDGWARLTPGEAAGIQNVANWNNAPGGQGTGPRQVQNLVTSTGQATNVRVRYRDYGGSNSTGSGGRMANTPTTSNLGDWKLMSAGLLSIGPRNYNTNAAQVQFTNLLAAFPDGFKAIVYIGDIEWSWGFGGGTMFMSRGSDYLPISRSPTFTWLPDRNGNFGGGLPAGAVRNQQLFPTHQAKTYLVQEGDAFAGQWIAGRNYVEFDPITLDSVTFTAWPAGVAQGELPPGTVTSFETSLILGVQLVPAGQFSPVAVPEPGLALPAVLGVGGLAAWAAARRRRHPPRRFTA